MRLLTDDLPAPEAERRFLRRFDVRASAAGARYGGRLWISPSELRFVGPAAPTHVQDRAEVTSVWITPRVGLDAVVVTVAGGPPEGSTAFASYPVNRETVWSALYLAGWPVLGVNELEVGLGRPDWFHGLVERRAGWLIVEADRIGIETRRTARWFRRARVQALEVSPVRRGGRLVIRTDGGDRETTVVVRRPELVVDRLAAAGWPVRDPAP